MTGTEDFIRLYGKELFLEVLNAVLRHSEMRKSETPENEEQCLYFSLMNMIDFECFKYGDAPKGLTQQKVIEFLKDHRDSIKCEPPTYLGLMLGKFSFLHDEKAGENPKKVPE